MWKSKSFYGDKAVTKFLNSLDPFDAERAKIVLTVRWENENQYTVWYPEE